MDNIKELPKIHDENLQTPPLFYIKNRSEAEKFDFMLHERTRKWAHEFSPKYICLAKTWDLCLLRHADGKKIFMAIVDIKLNLAMLIGDQFDALALQNKYIKLKVAGISSILESQDIFDIKTNIHRHSTAFIFRYRAIWDKIMSVLVLIIAPEKHDAFDSAKSRKKKFIGIMKEAGELQDFSETINKILVDFDNKFRTPEAHGAGRLRNFSLSMLSFEATPLLELPGYWNILNTIINEIGEIIDKAHENLCETPPK